MIMFLTLLALILVPIILWLVLDTIKPPNYPPGPKWLPIVGNFLQFQKLFSKFGYHHLVYQELSRKYGNIVGTKMGRVMVVSVFGADAVNEVLSRDEFDGRPDGYFFRLRTFGKRLGVIFSEGEFWKKQRKFSLQHLRNFGYGRKEMEEKIQEETRSLIVTFKRQSSDPIGMDAVFDVSVLNVLWTMMAGERFELDDARLLKLLQIIHDAFKLIDSSGGMLNQLPFLRFIAPQMCGYTQIYGILSRMWEFLEETISEHKKTVCHSHARDLIDAFLQKMNVKSDATFTDDQLMSLCLDLLMAGSETTNNTLGFSVIYMLRYPQVQKKVQKEIDEVVGRNRWPSLQDRIHLKYTEAVLMEIQRLANIAPLGIAHRTTKSAELRGYQIPEGTIILTSIHSVHMDREYWKDPENFRPERFLNQDGSSVVFDEKQFIPFGFGKRRCMGEALAKANMFLFFTAILYNFHLEIPKGEDPPEMQGWNGLTLTPKPYKVKLIPRD